MDEASLRWLFSVVVCGLAVLGAAGWLVADWFRRRREARLEEFSRTAEAESWADRDSDPEDGPDAGEPPPPDAEGDAETRELRDSQRRQADRRRLGAGLVLVIAVAFHVAANHLDPAHDGRSYVAIWLIILVQVMWLLVLAAFDFRDTLRRQALRRRLISERLKAWRRDHPGQVPPVSLDKVPTDDPTDTDHKR